MGRLKMLGGTATATHVAWLTRQFGRPHTAPFSPEDLEVLAETLESIRVQAGQKILTPGQPAEAAYIVERGEVELFVRRGRRRMLIGIQRPGGAFGDVPLLCEMPFPYLAQARTDASLLRLQRDALTMVLKRHPSIASRWLTSVVKRLEEANRRIIDLTIGDLESRALALLAGAVVRRGTSDIQLTQSEIAALLGATRSSVNRVLRALAKDRLISQEYGRIEILEPEQILQRAGGPKLFEPYCT